MFFFFGTCARLHEPREGCAEMIRWCHSDPPRGCASPRVVRVPVSCVRRFLLHRGPDPFELPRFLDGVGVALRRKHFQGRLDRPERLPGFQVPVDLVGQSASLATVSIAVFASNFSRHRLIQCSFPMKLLHIVFGGLATALHVQINLPLTKLEGSDFTTMPADDDMAPGLFNGFAAMMAEPDVCMFNGFAAMMADDMAPGLFNGFASMYAEPDVGPDVDPPAAAPSDVGPDVDPAAAPPDVGQDVDAAAGAEPETQLKADAYRIY